MHFHINMPKKDLPLLYILLSPNYFQNVENYLIFFKVMVRFI